MSEQKIGKYRILERIGRGGMGTIFKAHDPLLDRMVALKVISSEIEVTDELRTRFFREAQACAKLNHPNIVTVYDLGEDDGRLFIVMELLEGQELRRLIVPGTPLSLEDKLSVMTQVCGGLHYAHQKGIVHRDMKPGNVFLLGNGRVKILDFGIAHMATNQDGLTRTGLIMGTLRYISPEQLRGRADHHSDMFSVGSVFYELLTLRPAFTGEDPMHLLEQLRSQDPPSPSEIDASVPEALTAIVQRALRKEPTERFRDLEEMRIELEHVQRSVTEERYRVSARVRDQRERLVQLEGRLAERFGHAEHSEIPPLDERKGLAAIQAMERTLASRIAELEGKIAEAEAVAPAVERAEALLEAGRVEDAVAQFEAIVAEAAQHQRGQDGLRRARAAADALWRGRRGHELAQRAHAALRDRRYALCLEILKQAIELTLPPGVAEELRALRDRAVAEQEAFHRERQEVEDLAGRSAAARGEAQAEDAAHYAPEPWNEAQATMAAAEASVRREAYAEARAGFEGAEAAYRQARAAAVQARTEERRTAEQAREGATQAQRQARTVDAAEYTRGLWEAAEAKLGEGQAAFDKPAPGLGRVQFTEAAALYRRAEESSREARERERHRAAAARERAAEGRRSAEAVDAEHRVPSTWQDAGARSTAGESAWVRGQYPRATEAFEAALGLYHQAQAQVREQVQRHLEESGRKRAEVAEGRRRAESAEAAAYAPAEWAEAEASASAAQASLEREAWAEGTSGLDRTVALYRLAEERAADVLRARVRAEKGGADAAAARRGALTAEAPRYAAEGWQEAEMAQARAVAAFSRQQFPSAREQFEEAVRLYGAARQSARLAAESGTPRATVLARPDATHPAGGTTAVAEAPAPTVPAATVAVPEGGSPSPVGELERTRRVTPEPDAVDAPDPWRGRAIAIAGGVVGLVAVVLVIAFYPGTKPSPPARTPATVERPPDRGVADAVKSGPSVADTSAGNDGDKQLPARTFSRPSPGPVPPRRDPIPKSETAPKRDVTPTARTDVAAKTDVTPQRAVEKRDAAPNAEAPAKREPAAAATVDAPRAAATSRADVDRLTVKVNAARRAAEQTAAAFWVPQLMAAARAKERLAATALERPDHAAAGQLLSEAESEYRAAAERAKAAADAEHKVSDVKGKVMEWRGTTVARRAEAVTAQAGRLARDEFDAAETAHREADDLDKRGEFAAAARAYESAATKYREAAARANAR